MRTLRVWFPLLRTEYHREVKQRYALAESLARHNVQVQPEFSGDCDAVFCGSIWQSGMVRSLRAKGALRGRPILHYVWDLYPWAIKFKPESWQAYMEELTLAERILVPSSAVVRRISELLGSGRGSRSTVVRAYCRPWEPHNVPESDDPKPGSYAMDVVRPYEGDPNLGLVKRICGELKIPLVESQTKAPWDKFRRLVVGARFLISPYFEASTGGLTLLEGLWHGVPSLISRSSYNGAEEYLGDRASYFVWDDPNDLRRQLRRLWEDPPKVDVAECRRWISEHRSEDEFARKIADHVKAALLEMRGPPPGARYHRDSSGYIVWREGTGGNTEILDIRVFEQGQGSGTRMIKHLLDESGCRGTVYGFTRVGNSAARTFYQKLGFDLSEVSGVYLEGRAVVFSQESDRLRQTISPESQ